jgi:hypothetical protein
VFVNGIRNGKLKRVVTSLKIKNKKSTEEYKALYVTSKEKSRTRFDNVTCNRMLYGIL